MNFNEVAWGASLPNARTAKGEFLRGRKVRFPFNMSHNSRGLTIHRDPSPKADLAGDFLELIFGIGL